MRCSFGTLKNPGAGAGLVVLERIAEGAAHHVPVVDMLAYLRTQGVPGEFIDSLTTHILPHRFEWLINTFSNGLAVCPS